MKLMAPAVELEPEVALALAPEEAHPLGLDLELDHRKTHLETRVEEKQEEDDPTKELKSQQLHPSQSPGRK